MSRLAIECLPSIHKALDLILGFFIFGNNFIIDFCVCLSVFVYLCVYMHTCTCYPQRPGEGVRSPEAGVTGGCNMTAGIQTLVLGKSCEYS